MFKKISLVVLTSSLFVGCASVPMESKQASEAAKSFPIPEGDNAGLYIYRSSGPGTALKKDVCRKLGSGLSLRKLGSGLSLCK